MWHACRSICVDTMIGQEAVVQVKLCLVVIVRCIDIIVYEQSQSYVHMYMNIIFSLQNIRI